MEIAHITGDTETIADLQRQDIGRLARAIGDWVAGIVSSVECGAVGRRDIGEVHLELAAVERRLERLTTEIVLDR